MSVAYDQSSFVASLEYFLLSGSVTNTLSERVRTETVMSGAQQFGRARESSKLCLVSHGSVANRLLPGRCSVP